MVSSEETEKERDKRLKKAWEKVNGGLIGMSKKRTEHFKRLSRLKNERKNKITE